MHLLATTRSAATPIARAAIFCLAWSALAVRGLDTAPASFNESLTRGDSRTSTLTLTNNGPEARSLKLNVSVLQAPSKLQLLSSQGAVPVPAHPDRLLVKFKAGALSAASATKVLSDLGATASTTKVLSRLGVQIVTLPSTLSTEEATKILQERDSSIVEASSPDFEVQIDSVNDPRYGEQWALHNPNDADIDMPEAWSILPASRSDVLTMVIDTGVDYTHQDLSAQMWRNPGEIAGNGVDDDNNGYVDDVYGIDTVNNDADPMDDHGHGTHCAGVIGATTNNADGMAGIAVTKIAACKFLSARGGGSISGALECMEYAVQIGAQITSNSWGGGGASNAFREALRAAEDAGMLFIAAAGNSNSDNDQRPHYPSSYALDSVISVAATDNQDRRSSFSCYGRHSVDLGAPGSDILSTIPGRAGREGGYASWSGTSMATPQVAGVAALIWSVAPRLSWREVRAAILLGADPLASLEGKTVTGGRLNAHRSVELSLGVPSWVRLAPSQLQLASGESAEVAVTFDASASSLGLHRAHIEVYAAAGTTLEARVPVDVSVLPGAQPAPTTPPTPAPTRPGRPTPSPTPSPTRPPTPAPTRPPTPAPTPPPASLSVAHGLAVLRGESSDASFLHFRNRDGDGEIRFEVDVPPEKREWFSVSPAAGRIEAGEGADIALRADAASLPEGPQHVALTVRLLRGGRVLRTRAVPVRVHVQPNPRFVHPGHKCAADATDVYGALSLSAEGTLKHTGETCFNGNGCGTATFEFPHTGRVWIKARAPDARSNSVFANIGQRGWRPWHIPVGRAGAFAWSTRELASTSRFVELHGREAGLEIAEVYVGPLTPSDEWNCAPPAGSDAPARLLPLRH